MRKNIGNIQKLAFSSKKEMNEYFKKIRHREGISMLNDEDQNFEEGKYVINYDYIACIDYTTHMEVFFTSNLVKHKNARGLKILSSCDFNHNLNKNINALRYIVTRENDLNKSFEKISEFCHVLDEKYNASSFDLSKEHWVIRLHQILSEFSLAKREIDFLIIKFHLEYNRPFEIAIEDSGVNSFKEYFALLEEFFGFPSKYFNGILNDGMPLVELGIIDIDWNATHGFGENIRISGNLIAAVNSIDTNKNILSYFYDIEKKSKLKISSFQAYQSDVENVKKILQNSIKQKIKGINILLYGPPGTGKTEFAKSLAREISVDLAVVENSSQSVSHNNSRSHGRDE